MGKIESYTPKVLVLSGYGGRQKFAELPGDFHNGTKSWAYALGGDYINTLRATPNDLQGYDIIIANSNPGKYIKHLNMLAESRRGKTKWVTIIEGDATHYLTPNENFKDLLGNSDLINCINIFTLPFFRSMSDTNAEYIGMPYPVDEMSGFATPIENRKKEVMICHKLLLRWNDRLVARKLGMPYYGFEKRFHRGAKHIGEIVSNKTLNPNYYFNKVKNIYDDPNLGIKNHIVANKFYSENSSAYLWLNLDERYTWGRFVLDAAALRIPIITTKSTGHGMEFFPDTCLENEFEIDKAIEIGRRLIDDEEFYRHVAEYPAGKMEHLKADAMKEKLFAALGI